MNSSQILDNDDVDLIRSLYKEGERIRAQIQALEDETTQLRRELREVSMAAIGRKFGVSAQHIHRIIRYRSRPLPRVTTGSPETWQTLLGRD